MKLRFLASLLWLGTNSAFAQDDPPPEHLNLGGLCGLSSEILGSPDRVVHPIVPAGDVDGDGRDDLLFRNASAEPGALPEDLLVLLYGQPYPEGTFDAFAAGVRRTVITVGRLDPDLRRSYDQGLAGGEDVDGDRRSDLLVTSGFEARVGGPAIILIQGPAGGGPLPAAVDGNMIGNGVRGSLITERNAPPDRIIGTNLCLSADINGDGRGEILIVGRAEGERPRCCVLFGSPDLPATFDLTEIGSTLPGLVVETDGSLFPCGDRCGTFAFSFSQLSPLGDLDGDGLTELGFMTRANFHDPLNGIFNWASFIVFGRRDFPPAVVLEELGPGEGIILPRYEAVARGGDVDGDGFEEAVLFHPAIPLSFEDVRMARVHLLYGRPRPFLPSLLDRQIFETEGLGITVELHPQGVPDYTEGMPAPFAALTRGRDLDGDGRTEIAFGHSHHVYLSEAGNIHKNGSAFIVRGSDRLPVAFPADTVCDAVDLWPCFEAPDSIAHRLGVRIDGAARMDKIAQEVHLLGDFDGDGTPDLLLVNGGENRERSNARLLSGKALERGAPPRLGRIFPVEGPLSGGNTVVLFGLGFTFQSLVRFDGVPAEVLEVRTGILTVKAPPGSFALPVTVSVTTEFGETTGCGAGYSYRPDPEAGITVGGEGGRNLTVSHAHPEEFLALGFSAGDFTGDGKADLACIDRERTGPIPGAHLHVLVGPGSREPREVDLDALSPPAGATIEIPAPLLVHSLGNETTPPGRGDLNGDGRGDLVLGVRNGLPGQEEWWVVLGRSEFPHGAALGDLPGIIRFGNVGEGDLEGAAAIVPDVTGDGRDDLIISVLRPPSTDLYLVRGGPELETRGALGPLDLPALVRDRLAGQYSVDLSLEDIAGSAGDLNGDGLGDFYFGGSGVIFEGALAILHGALDLFTGSPLRLEDAFGDRRGLLIAGEEPFAGADLCALAPGDLDGDGRGEIFFRRESPECPLAPCSGLGFVFDRAAVLGEGFSAADLPGIAAQYSKGSAGLPDFAPLSRKSGGQEGVLIVRGAARGEGLGAVAAPAGDFNGDGFRDLLLGNRRLEGLDFSSNTCHVVWGGAGLRSDGPLDLAVPAGRSVTIRAAGIPDFGIFVDGGFDWDGDGVDDLLLGGSEGRVDLLFGEPRSEMRFVRGDGNGDDGLDVSDAVTALGFLFLGNVPPRCLDAIDLDDNGVLEISDPIYLLAHLFLSGPAPLPPHPEPGLDPTADAFRCVRN